MAAFGDLYEYVPWHADPLWQRVLGKAGSTGMLSDLLSERAQRRRSATRTRPCGSRSAILDSTTGPEPYARVTHLIGRGMLAGIGGYELATGTGAASLVNGFRRMLGPRPDENQDQDGEPEAGSLHVSREARWRRC
jgi:hypothetical protein